MSKSSPLINSFTKNLSPCRGCGNSATAYFLTQQEKGETVDYLLSIKVQADNLIDAVNKKDQWVVVDGRPAPPQRPTPPPNTQTATRSIQSSVPTTTVTQPNG